jgi:Domain of unknown function (DUF4190)
MSDTAQGPGWWLASDGHWYPPELWTGPAPAANPPAWTTAPDATVPVPAPAQSQGPYGYPRQPPSPYAYAPAKRGTNGLAIASLVCSCVGIVLLGVPSIVGIVLGFVARSRIRRSNGVQGGDGLALAGIIVGFVVVGLVLLVIIVNAAHNRTGQ